MIVVIQCADSKLSSARLKTARGKAVAFVARPELAPADQSIVYARPDDISDDGRSWRQVLLDYNSEGLNPQALLEAYKLYREPVYRRLADALTFQRLYILSAGWGLIGANFLIPHYDITLSQMKPDKKYKQRRKGDRYDDFAMIPRDSDDRIVFFGSRRYVPLFSALTREVRSDKIVFFNTDDPPEAPGCTLKKFTQAKRNTNWQYDCANAFLNGEIGRL